MAQKTPGGTPQGLSEAFPCTGSVESQLPRQCRYWMEKEEVLDRFPVSSQSFLQLHKSSHPVVGLLTLLLNWSPKEQSAARSLGVQGAGRSLSHGECGCSHQDQCCGILNEAASSFSIPSKGRLHQCWPRHLQRENGRWRRCPGNWWSFTLWRHSREFVEFPSLETFQTHSCVFLCHLLQVTFGGVGVGPDGLQRSLPTPMIL